MWQFSGTTPEQVSGYMSRHLTLIKSKCYWCESEVTSVIGGDPTIEKTYKNSKGEILPVCKKHNSVLEKVWETRQFEDGLWVVVKDEVV